MKRSTDNKKPDPIPHERPRSSYRRDDFHVQAHYPGDAGKEGDFISKEDEGAKRAPEDSQE